MVNENQQDGQPRRKKFKLPWIEHRLGYITHYCVIVIILIPLLLAAIGALAEYIIYVPNFNPRFHVKWMPLAGLIAAPFVLLRIFWRWPQHLIKLELVFYIVQSVAYYTVLSQSVIAGKNYYLANRAIRNMFTMNDDEKNLFQMATSDKKVWKWLEHVIHTVYSTDVGRSLNSRPIAGSRLRMLTSLKLRQHRTVQVCCSPNFVPFYEPLDECTPMFNQKSESKATYGTNTTFNYTDVFTRTMSGRRLAGDSFHILGTFGMYSLAGFSTFFTPSIEQKTAVSHLRAMRESGWIDFQTRAIVVEIALTSPDFLQKPVWAATTFLLERDYIGRFVPSEPTVHFNYNDISAQKIGAGGGGPLDTCSVVNASDIYLITPGLDPEEVGSHLRADSEDACTIQIPGPAIKNLYLGVVPIVVYILTVSVVCIVRNYRHFLSRPFHFTELLWVVLLMTVLGIYMSAFHRTECAFTSFQQPVFAGLDPHSLEGTLSRFAPRAEFLPLADILTSARRFLAISIFVHFFNGLRFLIRLKALGVMVRTLYFSSFSLFSFSVSFFIIFFGFVVMFYYIYSLDVEGFQDLPRTIVTLWLGMLGEISLTPELYRATYWTISLYILFTFVSAFVLLTVIISIISNAHEKALAAGIMEKEISVELASVGAVDASSPGPAEDQTQPKPKKRAFSNLVSEMEVLNQAMNSWKAKSHRGRVAPSVTDITSLAEQKSSSVLLQSDSQSVFSSATGDSNQNCMPTITG